MNEELKKAIKLLNVSSREISSYRKICLNLELENERLREGLEKIKFMGCGCIDVGDFNCPSCVAELVLKASSIKKEKE